MSDTTRDATRAPFDCTNCGQTSMLVIERVLKRDGAGKVTGEVTQFTCPHCGKVYTTAFMTARGMRYRDDLVAAKARMEAHPDVEMHRADVQRLVALVQAETRPLGLARA